MWENFFETTDTIGEVLGFPMYGQIHMTWLAAIAVTVAAVAIIYRRGGDRTRGTMLWCVAALTVGNEIAKYIVLGSSGHFTADYLPLHLCSINIFVILAHAITKNDYLAEILYAASMPAAAAALLFPSWTSLPPTSFMHIHSFTVHTELFLYPLLLIVGGFKPNFRRLLRALPFIAVTAAGVFMFNKAFDTNFMFLNGAGEGNPLSLFEGILGDPGYLLSLPLLLAVVWAAMYGVPALRMRFAEKSSGLDPEAKI